MMTVLQPCLRRARPATITLLSPVSLADSVSLTTSRSARAHDFAELVPLRLDPDVDGVREDEAGRGELVEHVELQVRADVAEHHERRREVRLGQGAA
jgi:hypothetical protein